MMPPEFTVHATGDTRPLARYEVHSYAYAEACRLTRETGRQHCVFRRERRDATRPQGQGVLVRVATA